MRTCRSYKRVAAEKEAPYVRERRAGPHCSFAFGLLNAPGYGTSDFAALFAGPRLTLTTDTSIAITDKLKRALLVNCTVKIVEILRRRADPG